MPLLRPALRLLLAIALVLSQQQASLHMLAHAADEVARHHDSAVPVSGCEDCIAFASLVSVASAGNALLQLVVAPVGQCPVCNFLDADRPFGAAYSSRAPPFTS